ncbi:MAG: hypothetical protein HYT90_03055 [Candidatus Omnitrophica bacterium]|nr:hypothetical protein [Candidatus Omnitrophota bacterium]
MTVTITIKHVYKTNGNYLGFFKEGLLFSRDGDHLGWIEGELVWDLQGRFRGILFTPEKEKNIHYIIRNRLSLEPITRPTKPKVDTIAPPPAPENVKPITLPVQIVDAFE